MNFTLLSTNGRTPSKGHAEDAGTDLYAAESKWLWPFFPRKIKTDVALEIPSGHVGLLRDRSSMGAAGIIVCGGVIDSTYRGNVLVCLCRILPWPRRIKKGDKITQILTLPVNLNQYKYVSHLSKTTRGAKGFGSTGV